MPDLSVYSGALQQRLWNDSTRLKRMEAEGVDTAKICGIELRFSAADEMAARSIAQALFVKGARMLPAEDAQRRQNERWRICVSVTHSALEITAESYVTDLVQMATAMGGSYDGWELLPEDGGAAAMDALPGDTGEQRH